MAIWYPPPPPSQGPFSGTPPFPHAVPPTPPTPPPFRQVQAVVAMATILASWPADLEPRLIYPNNKQVKNAAVIPPPPVPATPYVPQRIEYRSWPSDLEPRLAYPNNQQVKNAAVIPAPPNPFVPYSGPQDHIVGAWDTYELDVITTWTIAPDNPDQPPVNGPITPTELNLIVRSWDPGSPPWQKPPQPVFTTTAILPSELLGGNLNLLVRSWDPVPLPWHPAPSVAWIPAPSAYNPVGPLSLDPPIAETIYQQWVLTWPAQTGPDCAAWNIPTIPIVARTPPPRWLWTAWEPLPPYPPRPVSIVIATLPTGIAPPPVKSISNANLGVLVSQWAQNWAAQRISPRQNTSKPHPPFKPEWAENSNQILGPWAPQPVTH